MTRYPRTIYQLLNIAKIKKRNVFKKNLKPNNHLNLINDPQFSIIRAYLPFFNSNLFLRPFFFPLIFKYQRNRGFINLLTFISKNK